MHIKNIMYIYNSKMRRAQILCHRLKFNFGEAGRSHSHVWTLKPRLSEHLFIIMFISDKSPYIYICIYIYTIQVKIFFNIRVH